MSVKVSLRKIKKMELLTFQNALRLHLDSIRLFRSKSFPSSLFLSVLSLEEIGKATILSNFVFHSEVDGRMSPEWEQKWLNAIYQHRIKQSSFPRNSMFDLPKYFKRLLPEGNLERLKQSSVYVGFQKKGKLNSRLSSPMTITRARAMSQISIVNDYLRVLSLGIHKDVYVWENVDVTDLLNLKLYNKLSSLWPLATRSATQLIKRLQTF